MDERKKKIIGIAAVVVVIIVIIVIVASSGSEIEGEWVAIRAEYGGVGEDLYASPVTFIFYDDGTVDRISYSGSVSTYTYSYSKGRLAIDGEVVDCTIHGETMRWDYDDGTGIELRRR